jgi:hypothetical protein
MWTLLACMLELRAPVDCKRFRRFLGITHCSTVIAATLELQRAQPNEFPQVHEM